MEKKILKEVDRYAGYFTKLETKPDNIACFKCNKTETIEWFIDMYQRKVIKKSSHICSGCLPTRREYYRQKEEKEGKDILGAIANKLSKTKMKEITKETLKVVEKVVDAVSEAAEDVNKNKVKEIIEDIKEEIPNPPPVEEIIVVSDKLPKEPKEELLEIEVEGKIKKLTFTEILKLPPMCGCSTKLVEIKEKFAGYEKGQMVCPKCCVVSIDDYIAYELKRGNLPILPERSKEEILKLKEGHDKENKPCQLTEEDLNIDINKIIEIGEESCSDCESSVCQGECKKLIEDNEIEQEDKEPIADAVSKFTQRQELTKKKKKNSYE